VRATSAEARGLIRDVREGDGTLARLVRDDDLYQDLKEIAGDAKGLVKRVDRSVEVVEAEMGTLKGFVTDGRDTLRSVRQGTDAIAKMPIIRGYVEDAAALLVRPAHHRERMAYNTIDLFQPGTALPREDGRQHFGAVAAWLRGQRNDRADVVVVAFCDPNDSGQTPASALELTRKQAEVMVEYLRAEGVHKIGWTARRKMTPLGMGMSPSPVVEREPLPPSNLQVLLFTPQ
jgi:phospholipid/cholesterol/gamma-HCH transport system substrate-binding protein